MLVEWAYPFIHKYLLISFRMPGTQLGTGCGGVSEADGVPLPPWGGEASPVSKEASIWTRYLRIAVLRWGCYGWRCARKASLRRHMEAGTRKVGRNQPCRELGKRAQG